MNTDWDLPAVDRYSLGQLVTTEEAEALIALGEEVPDEQIG